MKKLLIIPALLFAAWLVAQNQSTPKPLAEITPAGAMLYLEAKNFNAMLGDWNASAEKRAWLAGDNYKVFSRSRLYLRLKDVFDKYAGGVGIAPDMTLLSSVAGAESALAIYDINSLEFLYVTRLASAQAMNSVLWKAKEKFTARSAAGTPYYVKTDTASKRTACFAIAGDLLLLATREQSLIGALGLISGANGVAVRKESWFENAANATGAAGELRMVLNMDALNRAPSFRSYWIQRNRDDLRGFSAGIADLQRSNAEFREERVLLRQDPVAAKDGSAIRTLLPLAGNATVYRAWAQPDASMVLSLMQAKILLPGPSMNLASRTAPGGAGGAVELGDESDLETRLDSAPYEGTGLSFRTDRVAGLFSGGLKSVLMMQNSKANGSFVGNDSLIAVQGAGNFSDAAVRDALQQALEGIYTTSQLGVQWNSQRAGQNTIWSMDGLAPLAFAVKGDVLLVANRAEYLSAALPLLVATNSNVVSSYAAGYRVTGELDRYTRLMRMIEAPQMDRNNNEPPLFSANLPSLVRAVSKVQSASVTANDDGRQVKQTVVYRLVP